MFGFFFAFGWVDFFCKKSSSLADTEEQRWDAVLLVPSLWL